MNWESDLTLISPHDARLPGIHGGLRAIIEVEFFQDVANMGFDRALANNKIFGNLGNGFAGRNQSQQVFVALNVWSFVPHWLFDALAMYSVVRDQKFLNRSGVVKRRGTDFGTNRCRLHRNRNAGAPTIVVSGVQRRVCLASHFGLGMPHLG